MITIKVINAKSKVICTLEEMQILRKYLSIRVPGAFFSTAFRERKWDGFCYYITEAGYISTGLIPKLCDFLDKENLEYELQDNRDKIKHKPIPEMVGKLELRGYQFDSVKSIVKNYYKDLYFPRGVINEATNAGKSLIAAALFKTYSDDKKFIFIVNRQHLYEQIKKEITELIGDEIGYIGKDGIKWNRFMVVMAPTLRNHLSKFRDQLLRFDVCIVDECHYASSATYREILMALGNCYVRVGMSGTPFKHKDKNKNERILSFFGPTLHTTSNDDLIKLGFSTKPVITISPGNTKIKVPKDYKEEEKWGLIKSKERNGKVLKRVRHHLKKSRLPMMVVCKFHNHTELVYRKIKKKHPDLRIEFIHVKVKNRLAILKDFKDGKIDILVTSKLIKEGQNLPLIQVIIMACGGASVIDVLQVVGRALRKHNSKRRVWIDDFWDEGAYLKRHSKYRFNTYRDEKFKIIDKRK